MPNSKHTQNIKDLDKFMSNTKIIEETQKTLEKKKK